MSYTPFRAPRSTGMTIRGQPLRILGRIRNNALNKMSQRRSSNRVNKLERKITGFKISRFRLFSQGGNTGSNRTMSIMGAGPVLENRTLLFANGVPGATTNYSYPGTISKLRTLLFVPTWPGTKLSSFTDDQRATFDTPAVTLTLGWGLEFPNQIQNNANLPYNSAGVANVSVLGSRSATPMTSTQLINHDHIKVFSTKIHYELRNLSPLHKYDIHIFDVIFRVDDFYDFDGTCKNFGTASNIIEELIMRNTQENNEQSAYDRLMFGKPIVDGIRRGKLPSKIFKVLSHKKITLGRAKPVAQTINMATGSEYPVGITNPTTAACKRWTKTYKQKIWYKGPCDVESAFTKDDLLTDNKKKTVHTLMIPLLNESDMTGAAGTTASTVYAEASIAYTLKKVCTWKIKSN